MAPRDQERPEHDRYRYTHHSGNPASPGRRSRANEGYYSDNDDIIRRSNRSQPQVSMAYQVPSPPPRASRHRRTRREGDRPETLEKQAPSPPRLFRNRSTGKVGHAGRHREEKVPTPQYLSPDAARKPRPRSTSGGSEDRFTPRRSFPAIVEQPTVPKLEIPTSEESKPDNSRSRRPEGRPWAQNAATKQQVYASVNPSSTMMAPSSSSSPSVLGEKLYQYMELKPFEFRLVRIFPAKMFAIKCEILHESLTHPPPYTALSYAWGDVDDKRTIQLGNIEISVGMGLYGGLEAIRQKGEDVLVWADALCIDQQNRDERSSQVQMMTEIYAKATSVAIWLGPAENKSHLAAEFLKEIAVRARDPEQIQAMISQDRYIEQIEAVACLFQRDYWSRLWVVQEVFNARSISVYCGLTKLPWSLYKTAAQVFQRHKKDLDLYFSGTASDSRNRRRFSTLTSSLSYAQVLVYDGPGSLLDFGSLDGVGDEALLDVMRTSRRKLTSEPRDKIFGVLGVLPEDIRREFPVDYSLSVKDVYTDIVDFLIYTTERLDVICESIHFPAQTHTARLPSWVPDWSQHSETSALGHLYNFSAARDTNARYQFLDKRRNELKISAIYIDTIRCHGIAVGTLCTLADYLMAFLHWRALLLDYVSSEPADYQMEIQEAFCRTLSLGQVPSEWRGRSQDWMRRCYEVFATHIRKRLPQLPLDDQLHAHLLADGAAKQDIRQFLQRNFGAHMMGRSFFISRRSRVGMGSGFMLPDDIIVVPLGCRTPIILREEGGKEGRYRYVGDVYVDGYMDGKAIDLLNSGEKQLKEYVLV